MDQLSSTFAALADPTRRAILARLSLGETSVTELASPFEMSMPAVSKHLKVLERAGLIARGREAQWRPCRLDAGPLKDAFSWIEDYRRFWTAHVDALESYLDRMDEPAPAQKHKSRKSHGSNRQQRRGEKK
jgi:DNA-binding transcriptional ArsR family regulator